jgi:hypothetical protein
MRQTINSLRTAIGAQPLAVPGAEPPLEPEEHSA